MKSKLKTPIISIQGIEGSFHDIAKNRLFPRSSPILGRENFIDVFNDVVNNQADFGILAIENSIAGPILENYTHLSNFKVFIIKELFLKITHHLISFSNIKLNDIKEVHAHPMVFKQCQKFFIKNPQIKQINNFDSAAAVKMIKNQNLKNAAAIASRQAAKIFNMNIIQSHLEDQTNNFTRFLVISTNKVKIL